MKAAQKKAIQAECVKVILRYGAVQTEPGSFDLETPIGNASVRVDANCSSKVMSLFVRFDQAATAKSIFGHWKNNLHEFDIQNFAIAVEYHLNDIFEKLAPTPVGQIITAATVLAKKEPDYDESERLGIADALTILAGEHVSASSEDIYDALKNLGL